MAGREFHDTFSYIFSLSILKTIRRHKLTLAYVCIFNQKSMMGYLWKGLLIMKESKQ